MQRMTDEGSEIINNVCQVNTANKIGEEGDTKIPEAGVGEQQEDSSGSVDVGGIFHSLDQGWKHIEKIQFI
jgi:hypothetical protein